VKKILVALAAMAALSVVAVVAVPAFAGSSTAPFYTVTGGSSDNVTNTLGGGSVMFNAPSGNVALIINGNVKGLQPNFEYAAWVRDIASSYTGPSLFVYAPNGYVKLGTFSTNSQGNGSFHFNIQRSDLPAGTYNLQAAINDAGTTDDHIGATVVATQMYTTVNVG
jgi:hypothetical protein